MMLIWYLVFTVGCTSYPGDAVFHPIPCTGMTTVEVKMPSQDVCHELKALNPGGDCIAREAKE